MMMGALVASAACKTWCNILTRKMSQRDTIVVRACRWSVQTAGLTLCLEFMQQRLPADQTSTRASLCAAPAAHNIDAACIDVTNGASLQPAAGWSTEKPQQGPPSSTLCQLLQSLPTPGLVCQLACWLVDADWHTTMRHPPVSVPPCWAIDF